MRNNKTIIESTVCTWKETDEAWVTGCGNMFLLETGTPIENDFKFCPYCGRELKEK